MEQQNKVAIVIIIYNNAGLIIKQMECIRKFCKDDYEIIIIDNSDRQESTDAIMYRISNSEDLYPLYLKTQATTKDYSQSHAFACNTAYYKFKNRYTHFLFLDHDNFPVKEFSVKEILKEKIIGGLEQIRGKIKYFWAGCVMFDNGKIDKSLIDFSPNHELGLDTGGNLYKLIEKHGIDSCIFFNEVHCQNPYFNKSPHSFFSLINNEMFMHFINSSNWASWNDNTERINSLLNILEEKICKND